MNILVINSGSSSVKYKIINPENKKILSYGHVDGIGLDSCTFIKEDTSEKVFIKNHEDAIALVLNSVDKKSIDAVGHRFVHGGSKYSESIVVNNYVVEDLKSLIDLAPLHNPHNLAGIVAAKKLLDVPQVIVFDTAFHESIPKKANSYALPKKLVDEHGLKKFGFHGISHKYLAQEAKDLLGRENVNLITCHLGNGASVSCIKRGECVDTSMGFSPIQGLVMGSRSGDVDPGLIIYLQEKLKLSLTDIKKMLNKESGLKGICGESDMRKVYEKMLDNDSDASLALEIFIYRLVHYIGAYLALMQADTHAIIFSGGIGEGAFYVRKNVCFALKHLGISLNLDKNMYNNGLINKAMFINEDASKIKVLVIPTNEELMIAREVFDLINIGESENDESENEFVNSTKKKNVKSTK